MFNSYRKYFYPFSVAVGWLVFGLTGGYSVEGAENVPRSGGVILAGNHVSLADPMAMLIASPRIPYYMAASNLFDIPVLGALIRYMQAFPVRRGESDRAAVAAARNYLRQGEAVVMYPEGKLSVDGYLGTIHQGALLLALRENCPIVPCFVTGTDKMLPAGAWFFHYAPGKRMRIGKPLYLGGIRQGVPLREQLAQAEAQLRQAYVDLGAKVRA